MGCGGTGPKMFVPIGLIVNENKKGKSPCYMGQMWIATSLAKSFATSRGPCHYTCGSIMFNML
jgi:hypothetical protein